MGYQNDRTEVHTARHDAIEDMNLQTFLSELNALAPEEAARDTVRRRCPTLLCLSREDTTPQLGDPGWMDRTGLNMRVLGQAS